jgi:hypothetical protein
MSCAAYAVALAIRLTTLEADFTDASPTCPQAAEHCVGIELFVVIEDGEPVQTPAWFAGEIVHANELFAPIDVGFELERVRFVGGQWAHVHSRLERDELGRREREPGRVHVFMVRQLDDVDIIGNQLYGVHWRDRGDTSNRWIIVSARDSSATVLAHETGHYFGLPHSSYEVSIMNKSPRLAPTWPNRVFAEPELAKMRRHRDRMLQSGFLKPRPRGGPGRPQREPSSQD